MVSNQRQRQIFLRQWRLRSLFAATNYFLLSSHYFSTIQVKHVTTHRSEPRGLSTMSESVYNHGPVAGAGAKRSVPEAFQPGVIVQ